MIVVRVMTIKDYDDVYELWMNTKGMGMRNLDDSRSGIAKFLERNPTTNFIASDGNKIVGVVMMGAVLIFIIQLCEVIIVVRELRRS